jgi:hypothetical protein
MVATLYRATGDGATTDGALVYALPDNRYLRGPYERSWGWSSW